MEILLLLLLGWVIVCGIIMFALHLYNKSRKVKAISLIRRLNPSLLATELADVHPIQDECDLDFSIRKSENFVMLDGTIVHDFAHGYGYYMKNKFIPFTEHHYYIFGGYTNIFDKFRKGDENN